MDRRLADGQTPDVPALALLPPTRAGESAACGRTRGHSSWLQMRIDYTAHIWREGCQFVAQAMPIDVVSSGSTPDQTRMALDEAVRLFPTTAQQMGTLQEVLEECSYEFHEGSWRAPEWVAVERYFALLLAVGFVFVRQEGRHRSYTRAGTPRPVVIPTYDGVPVSVVKSNLKTANVTRDECLRLLDST